MSDALATDVRLRPENEATQLSLSAAARSQVTLTAEDLNTSGGPPTAPPTSGFATTASTGPNLLSVPPGAAPSAYVGAVIDGRYVVEAVLGEGGMGFVYRCRHKLMDKLVAIKVLRQEIARDPEVTTRFVNEARAASAVGSPHIVQTIDFGQLANGSTYFVMEYLEGQTLSDVLASEPRLGIERLLDLGKQIAEGLGAAHDAGIVHRDLKPDNVYIVRRKGHDFVKILDFGIAKVQSAESKLTRAGTVFGTPHYMSPEQARGGVVDPRTDIYALGVILYEMAAGRVPFDAEAPMSILSQHIHEPPKPPTSVAGDRQIPPDLETVILKCMAKDPELRYQSMPELAEELTRIERGGRPRAALEALPPVLASGLPELASERRHFTDRFDLRTAFGVLLAVASLCVGIVLLALEPKVHGRVQPLFRRTVPSSTDTILRVLGGTPEEAAPAPVRNGHAEVALIMLPIDAEASADGRNLGAMPVTVSVPTGETVTVLVQRDGFYSRRVAIDGSKARVVVRLQPMPAAAKVDAQTKTKPSAEPAPAASASAATPAVSAQTSKKEAAPSASEAAPAVSAEPRLDEEPGAKPELEAKPQGSALPVPSPPSEAPAPSPPADSEQEAQPPAHDHPVTPQL